MIDKYPLIIIVGATAVGKTELAIQLAKRLNGEIISADSRYFYKGMDIGTAKPTPAELEAIPHHLVNILEPDQPMSLALFLDLADKAIRDIYSRKKTAIMVGGTGQFYSAVIRGWHPPQGEPNPDLRDCLNEIAEYSGKLALHHWLSLVDPDAAQRIDPSNLRRTVRALEVILTSGLRFSHQRTATGSAYDCITIGIARSRSEIFQRLDERIDEMVQRGWVDEVRHLLATGYSPEMASFSAIGYGEFAKCIRGDISLDMAIAQIRRRTRIFVRRQANWFKIDDPMIRWFWYSDDILDHLIEYLNERLLPVEGEKHEQSLVE